MAATATAEQMCGKNKQHLQETAAATAYQCDQMPIFFSIFTNL